MTSHWPWWEPNSGDPVLGLDTDTGWEGEGVTRSPRNFHWACAGMARQGRVWGQDVRDTGEEMNEVWGQGCGTKTGHDLSLGTGYDMDLVWDRTQGTQDTAQV